MDNSGVQRTASEAILQRLVEADVLETSGDRVILTDAFHSACEQESTGQSGAADGSEGDSDRVEIYETALESFAVGLDADERHIAADSLATIGKMSGETVAIEGEDLDALVASTRNIIVLVYKEGCDPCDRVREKLTALANEGVIPAGVVLAELLGTDCQRLLWEEYDVMGAPTILFARDGQIEMRLTGNVHTEQLRSDIQRLYA